MIRSYGLLVVAVCHFVAIGAASGQITITKSDVDANFLNSTWIAQYDTSTVTFNLGNSSNGQSWNFSSLNLNAVSVGRDTVTYVLPAGHVAASSFPAASACVTYHQVQDFGGDTMTVDQAQYFSSETDGVYHLGFGYRQQISPPPPPPFVADTTYIAFHRPKGLLIPLPMTNNGSTRTSTDTLTIPFDGSLQINTHVYTMSGSGTVTIPGGRSFAAIRLIDDQVSTVINFLGTTRTHERYVYFFGQDLTAMQFQTDTLYTSGTTQAVYYSLNQKASLVGVRESFPVLPKNIHLGQNYPNPFNPRTTITYALPASGHVKLSVYSMLGQEVATIVDGVEEAGLKTVPFDAGNLPSGIYTYRITAGTFTDVKKMVLLK